VQAIAAITTSGAAGKLRRIAVENIASCEGLPDDHWFWDLTLSGGIFVEHGVHFFDWCGSLLDAPESVIAWSAQSGRRQDRVFAAVSHAGGALATYYHAFIAKSEDERTHVSIAFDSCDIVVDGWIPTRMTLRGPKAQVAADTVRKMHRSMLRESAGPDGVVFDAGPKQAAYAAGVSSVAADFARAVASPSHRMLVDGKRALSSLRVAVAARESAQEHRRVSL
jgi:predicted dehydrogenase